MTGLDFSSVTPTYDGVASTLQTALRATSATTDLDNVEVTHDGVGVRGDVCPWTPAAGLCNQRASAAFTGDDADELGLDTATIVNGVDAIKCLGPSPS